MQAKLAFTMAEILLSLTIIGVVAAITLPSLTGNINERTWNTQRKALYARMSQAVALMPALNGYGSSADNASETFITNGLAKVLKINNICSPDSIADCGVVLKLSTLAASKIDMPKTLSELNASAINAYPNMVPPDDVKAAAFETANGESLIVFYNTRCNSDNPRLGIQANGGDWSSLEYAQNKMCANFIYDLNGKKGPNTVGKDIGVMSVFFPSDSVVVSPQIISTKELLAHDGSLYINLNKLCSAEFGEEYRSLTKWEMASAWLNRDIFGLTSEYGSLISTTMVNIPTQGARPYRISWERGFLWVSNEAETGIATVYCEKR